MIDKVFYSPIGGGSRIHIFPNSDRSLCLRGPALSYWPEPKDMDEVCKECKRKLEGLKETK